MSAVDGPQDPERDLDLFAPDDPYDAFVSVDDDDPRTWKCAFPGRCLMSGIHLRAECCTAEMMEDEESFLLTQEGGAS